MHEKQSQNQADIVNNKNDREGETIEEHNGVQMVTDAPNESASSSISQDEKLNLVPVPTEIENELLNLLVTPDEPLLGRRQRVKQPSVRLKGFATNTARRISSSKLSPSSTVCLGDYYSINHYLNNDKFSLRPCFLAFIS